MIRDIITIEDGLDLGLSLSNVPRAANVLSVQLGELEYANSFGIDKRYFLETPVLFQNESFKMYLVQRLTEHGINVSEVAESIYTLFSKLTFFLPQEIPAPDFSTRDILDNALLDADGAMLTDSDGAPLIDGLL